MGPVSTTLQRLIIAPLILLGIIAASPLAYAARVSILNLPEPMFLPQTSQSLLNAGCDAIQLNKNKYYIDIPTGKPYHVVPSDWRNGSAIFFCDSENLNLLAVTPTAQSLHPTGNNVLAVPEARAGEYPGGTSGVTAEIVDWIATTIFSGANWLTGTLFPVLKFFLDIFKGIGQFFAKYALEMVGFLLTIGPFTTHPMVKLGWPFVLGIANIGFILALLFIAFATTLRIETYGLKRMLPRLLIAVLLINFSLVIGGLIIDSSRVLMAVMARIMAPPNADGSPAALGAVILDATQYFEIIEALGSGQPDDTSNTPDQQVGMSNIKALTVVATKAVIMWILAGAMLVVVIQLFIRYVMLILLLIVSPLAYLAFAFPMAGDLAKKWWTSFLKYVFYGPAIMFILLLLTAFVTGLPSAPAGMSRFVYDLSVLGITTVLIIIAALTGKYVGMVGAAAAVGFVSGRGRRVMAGTAKGIGRAGALPATFVGRRVGRTAMDYGRSVRGEIGNKMRREQLFREGSLPSKALKMLAGAERDEQGKPLPGQMTAGRWMAERTPFISSKEKRAMIRDASMANREFNKAGAGARDEKEREANEVAAINQLLWKTAQKEAKGEKGALSAGRLVETESMENMDSHIIKRMLSMSEKDIKGTDVAETKMLREKFRQSQQALSMGLASAGITTRPKASGAVISLATTVNTFNKEQRAIDAEKDKKKREALEKKRTYTRADRDFAMAALKNVVHNPATARQMNDTSRAAVHKIGDSSLSQIVFRAASRAKLAGK